jgi:hypothetical protein
MIVYHAMCDISPLKGNAIYGYDYSDGLVQSPFVYNQRTKQSMISTYIDRLMNIPMYRGRNRFV